MEQERKRNISDGFDETYRRAVDDIAQFFSAENLQLIAKHNPGWGSDRFDVRQYLKASAIRYRTAVEIFKECGGKWSQNLRILDVGGFFAAFPLTLARFGFSVTIAEKYSYYYGAFDELRMFLERNGIDIWDADFAAAEIAFPTKRFDLIINMAMLEHLAHSPRILVQNIRGLLAPRGLAVFEVPNILYWPNRVNFMRGYTIHPPLADIYTAEVPFTGHHREYTVDDLVELMTLSGLSTKKVITFNHTPWPRGNWKQKVLLEFPIKFCDRFRETIMLCAGQK